DESLNDESERSNPASESETEQEPEPEQEQEPEPNERQFENIDDDNTFTERVQRGLSGLCVDALCHASTNNLTNLENITQLIGVQARGTAALYISPGSKEESYIYNVMLPANLRNMPVVGTQMPPQRAGVTETDIAQFRTELGVWIDNLDL
ncbi:MAG: hypothetical protein VX589_01575, partial [Myxococcota bacterium]|nr:hypothetical protein [Myxococcota bacterium]